MRLSIPTIPRYALINNENAIRPVTSITKAYAIERLSNFLSQGGTIAEDTEKVATSANASASSVGRRKGTAVITGAGVSVDSGIRAYRGRNGRYMNPNYKPIFYQELMDMSATGHSFRQRYWLRSYLGWPPVRDAKPNTTHTALAALQYSSFIRKLITQNVDGLHAKATRNLPGWDELQQKDRILELHGTLYEVHCSHGHSVHRETFQDWISSSNPQWAQYTAELERTGQTPRTNPDGDVELEGVSYDDFVVPDCPHCYREGQTNSVFKPGLIFFGESLSPAVRDRSFADIEACSQLLVIGSTLATFSAFRLIKRALELTKPVLLLNVGPTRADGLPGVEKVEMKSGDILRDVVKSVLGARASEDPHVVDLLTSGVYQPPKDYIEDDQPEAILTETQPLKSINRAS